METGTERATRFARERKQRQETRIAELETRLILDRDLVRDLQAGWRPSEDGLKQWEQRLNEVLRKSEQK